MITPFQESDTTLQYQDIYTSKHYTNHLSSIYYPISMEHNRKKPIIPACN